MLSIPDDTFDSELPILTSGCRCSIFPVCRYRAIQNNFERATGPGSSGLQAAELLPKLVLDEFREWGKGFRGSIESD